MERKVKLIVLVELVHPESINSTSFVPHFVILERYSKMDLNSPQNSPHNSP